MAVVPLMGLLETVAIAKAFGKAPVPLNCTSLGIVKDLYLPTSTLLLTECE